MKIIKSNKGQNKDVLYLREKDGNQFLEAAGSSGMSALGYGARDIDKVSYKEVKDGDLLYHTALYTIPETYYLTNGSVFAYDRINFPASAPSYLSTWVSAEYAKYENSLYIPMVSISTNDYSQNVEHSTSPTEEFPVVDIIDDDFINNHIINFKIIDSQTNTFTIQSLLVPDNVISNYAKGIENLHIVTAKEFSEYKYMLSKNYNILSLFLYDEVDGTRDVYCLGKKFIRYNPNEHKVYSNTITSTITPDTLRSLYLISIFKFNHSDYLMLNTFSSKGYSFALSQYMIGGSSSIIRPEYFDCKNGPSTTIYYGSYGILPNRLNYARLDEVLTVSFLRNIGEVKDPAYYDFYIYPIIKTPYNYYSTLGNYSSSIIPKGILSTIYNQKQFITDNPEFPIKVPTDWLYENFKIKLFGSSRVYDGIYTAYIKENKDFILLSINEDSQSYGYGYGGEYAASEQYIGEFEE